MFMKRVGYAGTPIVADPDAAGNPKTDAPAASPKSWRSESSAPRKRSLQSVGSQFQTSGIVAGINFRFGSFAPADSPRKKGCIPGE
jgi:hypothetical protein